MLEISCLSKYFGSVKFHQDELKIQKGMRNEWNCFFTVNTIKQNYRMQYCCNGNSKSNSVDYNR